MTKENRTAIDRVICRPVLQYKNNNLIGRFISAREASKQFNVDSSIISAVCRNNSKGKDYLQRL